MTRNELPDIEEVEPLSEKDDACINDIVEVLRRHNALTRFGVTLLHKHFPTDDGEVFVESCDPVTRTLTIKPFPEEEVRHLPSKGTAWRLDTGRPVMDCKCIRDGDSHSHQSRGYHPTVKPALS